MEKKIVQYCYHKLIYTLCWENVRVGLSLGCEITGCDVTWVGKDRVLYKRLRIDIQLKLPGVEYDRLGIDRVRIKLMTSKT